MQLHKWIKTQGRGALADLSRETGLAYQTVHAIYARKRPAHPKSALAISKATGGLVTFEELTLAKINRPKRRRVRARTRATRARVTRRTRTKAAA